MTFGNAFAGVPLWAYLCGCTCADVPPPPLLRNQQRRSHFRGNHSYPSFYHIPRAVNYKNLLPAVLVLVLVASACSTPDPREHRATPSARSGFALAFDRSNGNMVLFGGSDSSFVRLSDTWTWTPDGWVHHEVPGPSARSDAQVAYHAASGRVVLYGGLTDDGRSSETWTWDGEGWLLADSTGPPPRQLAHMAYDDRRHVIVLFGGSGAGRERLGDTWTWDGQAWSEANPPQSPSPRGAHMVAFDDSSQQVVVAGGYGTMTHADVWGWDGATWTPRDSTSMPARLHSSLVYDADEDGLTLFGGFDDEGRVNDLFVQRDGRWVRVTHDGPGPRAEHDAVFFPDVGYVVFGGVVGQPVSERVKTNETWVYHRGTWRLW